MMSFIKKDFLMIKANIKVFIMAIVIYGLLLLSAEGDLNVVASFLPFIAVMLVLSTFNYDEYNNWNAYAITLPNGRKRIVAGKYIGTVILLVITFIVGFIVSIAYYIAKDNLIIDEVMGSYFGNVAVVAFIIAVTYPLIFKFGIEKGRIAMLLLVFSIVGLGAIVGKIIGVDKLEGIISFLMDWQYIVFPAFSIGSLLISYFVSNAIYLKKEF